MPSVPRPPSAVPSWLPPACSPYLLNHNRAGSIGGFILSPQSPSMLIPATSLPARWFPEPAGGMVELVGNSATSEGTSCLR